MSETALKENVSTRQEEAVKSISRDRVRTSFLWKFESSAIAYLVQRVPDKITSNMLTGFGLFGGIVVFTGFVLASYFNKYWLLLGIPGFFMSWLGDSLDGRLAYYRNKPRKNYGFILDITVDWINIIFIGYGYMLYVEWPWDLFGYGFVVMYGWEMLMAVMRFKLTGKYSIDSGKFGPTEARIVIASIMVAEVFLPGSIIYSAVTVFIAFIFINISDTLRLLDLADRMDKDAAKPVDKL